MAAHHAANKRGIAGRLQQLLTCPVDELASAAAEAYATDARLFAFHPVNEAFGPAAIEASLWAPLRRAFPDLERREQIVAAGEFQGGNFVCCMSYLQGTFHAPLFEIPPTGDIAMLRCCEINKLGDDGRIVEAYVLIDMLDLMRQARVWPIAPSTGLEAPWLSPDGAGGVVLDTVDTARGAVALRIVKAMHAALGDFDGTNLRSMKHAHFWTDHFMWYGPSGIGTTRGLAGFEAHHQIPFLRAFPDRRGGQHVANVGDGDFVVTGGWPSVTATHAGSDWLGTTSTGKQIRMRVMDFYRLEGDLIAENWVPIDIIDILGQMGFDVFDRMRHLAGNPRRQL